MLDQKFIRKVPLPEGLTVQAVFSAMQNTQKFFTMIRTQAGINLREIIQANNFSGIVSNVFTKKLDEVSPYKLFHDQRYPDLMHEKRNIGLGINNGDKANSQQDRH